MQRRISGRQRSLLLRYPSVVPILIVTFLRKIVHDEVVRQPSAYNNATISGNHSSIEVKGAKVPNHMYWSLSW